MQHTHIVSDDDATRGNPTRSALGLDCIAVARYPAQGESASREYSDAQMDSALRGIALGRAAYSCLTVGSGAGMT